MNRLDTLCIRMIAWNAGDPKRVQHFLKVHSFAQIICAGEGVNEHQQELIEAAACVHDIGIRPAEEKYGSCGGKLQEQEGPAPARKMVLEAGYPIEDAERIAWLVGHHHTYDAIDGLDYQILVEADFLVNLYEDDEPQRAVREAMNRVFRTETGISILKTTFGL